MPLGSRWDGNVRPASPSLHSSVCPRPLILFSEIQQMRFSTDIGHTQDTHFRSQVLPPYTSVSVNWLAQERSRPSLKANWCGCCIIPGMIIFFPPVVGDEYCLYQGFCCGSVGNTAIFFVPVPSWSAVLVRRPSWDSVPRTLEMFAGIGGWGQAIKALANQDHPIFSVENLTPLSPPHCHCPRNVFLLRLNNFLKTPL